MNTHTVYFLVAVAIFLAVLIAAAVHDYYRARRSPKESWESLMRRLISVDRANVARIALDLLEGSEQSGNEDTGTAVEPSDILQLIGGLKGLEILEKNSRVLIEMGPYL